MTTERFMRSVAVAAYLRRRNIHGTAHLAALVAALGADRVARDSGLPVADLQGLLRHVRPPGGFSVVAPARFELGLVGGLDAATRPPPVAASGARLAALARQHRVTLPERFRLPLPEVTEETDQGRIGSCVAWAAAHAAEHTVAVQRGQPGLRLNPSSIYAIIKDQNLDPFPRQHGSTLAAAARCLEGFGALLWDEMPIHRDSPPDNPGNLPVPQDLYTLAVRQRCATPLWTGAWTDVSIEDVRVIVHGRELAVCTGGALFPSFFNPFTAETGFVSDPLEGEESIGGHAMALGGWDTVDGRLVLAVKNSHGLFGDRGWLYFSPEYVKNHFHPGFVVPRLATAPVAATVARRMGGVVAVGLAGVALAAIAAQFLPEDPAPNAGELEGSEVAAGEMRAASSVNSVGDARDPIAIYQEIVRANEEHARASAERHLSNSR